MDSVRIAELLHPFLTAPIPNAQPDVLLPHQLESISIYIDILVRWNSRINLTAIRGPEEIVTRHFGESLFAARVLFPRTTQVGTAAPASPERSRRDRAAERSSTLASWDNRGRTALQGRDQSSGQNGALAHEGNDQDPTTNDVADVGSGAGFPGIPLKLWNPAIYLTLIESNQKKSTFLKELVRALILTDIDIQNTRAETLPHSSFDVVTLRAVERFESVLPIAATLVKPAARLALLIGASQLEVALRLPTHVSWSPALPVPNSQSRVLLVGHRNKVST